MDINFGFGNVPKPQHVFVGKENNSCWYMLDENDKQIHIEHKAITGIITGIECNKQVETKFGITQKTDITILAPTPYIIRSGRESYFSKSLLLSLNVITAEQLQKPLTISVEPGEKTVVFCNIYDPATYQKINFTWDGHQNLNWDAIEASVSSKVNNNTTNQRSEIFDKLMVQSTKLMGHLGWDASLGRQYLEHHYNKKKRIDLTEQELMEFTFMLVEQSLLPNQPTEPVESFNSHVAA